MSRLFYEDEYDALAEMVASSGKTYKECAGFLWPHMKPESATAKFRTCLKSDGDEEFKFGQVLALMEFCQQFDPLYYACDQTLHGRPDRITPEDHEQRLANVIDKATDTIGRALRELNQMKRIRGVA